MGFKIWVTKKSVAAELEIKKNGMFNCFSLEISRKGVKFKKLLNLPF
jgi:hypothetical protein